MEPGERKSLPSSPQLPPDLPPPRAGQSPLFSMGSMAPVESQTCPCQLRSCPLYSSATMCVFCHVMYYYYYYLFLFLLLLLMIQDTIIGHTTRTRYYYYMNEFTYRVDTLSVIIAITI